jgi:hypothetical protein
MRSIKHRKIKMRRELVYLLGYFYADGYLSGKKYKYPILEMIRSDSENIIYCLEKINSRFTVSYRFRKNSKNEQACIRLSSSDENIDLFKNVLMDKVNMSRILNFINSDNFCYFLRGFFDGDGCINISKNKSKGRMYFYGSFEQRWELVFDILKKLEIKYTFQQIVRKNGSHKSTHICISNKHGINLLYEYIYPNRVYDFGLLRKYEKLNSIKGNIKHKHIVTHTDSQIASKIKTY